ncbi:hypothetical protein AVEN_232477-1 [Araneus ventricosus]|uniref:Uncharacterized protein n=1 Tax=Araneus ventricosus TaxID=182803 RepID=A0A4Y2QQB5_ARAVE|nr:hypothetical protein AVEN_232477-1 [Araneus ventricosus]
MPPPARAPRVRGGEAAGRKRSLLQGIQVHEAKPSQVPLHKGSIHQGPSWGAALHKITSLEQALRVQFIGGGYQSSMSGIPQDPLQVTPSKGFRFMRQLQGVLKQ